MTVSDYTLPRRAGGRFRRHVPPSPIQPATGGEVGSEETASLAGSSPGGGGCWYPRLLKAGPSPCRRHHAAQLEIGVSHIEVLDAKPADASPTVEGWVRFNADGSALPIVYISADTHVYRDAVGHDYQALVRLAGILAHERWHLRHGRDEVGAYTAQLSTMEYLHANTMHLAEIRRALRRITQGGTKQVPWG